MKDLAVAACLCDTLTTEEIAAKSFIQSIRDLNKKMNIPEKVVALKTEDIEKLAIYANEEANPIYPVPVLFNRKELERFYYDILETKDNFVDKVLTNLNKENITEKELVLR